MYSFYRCCRFLQIAVTAKCVAPFCFDSLAKVVNFVITQTLKRLDFVTIHELL